LATYQVLWIKVTIRKVAVTVHQWPNNQIQWNYDKWNASSYSTENVHYKWTFHL